MRRLFIALALVLGGVCAYRFFAAEPLRNEFVLPLGFRGAIRIDSNVRGGFRVVRDAGNRAVFHIPRTGVLRLEGPSPFHEYAQLAAEWSNGQSIPNEHTIAEVDFVSLALWTLYTDANDSTWLYVGPRSEYKLALVANGRLTAGQKVSKISDRGP